MRNHNSCVRPLATVTFSYNVCIYKYSETTNPKYLVTKSFEIVQIQIHIISLSEGTEKTKDYSYL